MRRTKTITLSEGGLSGRCFALRVIPLLCLFGALPLRAEVSFFSPSFERLDRLAMQARRDAPGTGEAERNLIDFFLSESDRFSGRPHAAVARLRPLLSRCEDAVADAFRRFAPADRAVMAYLCAMAESEVIAASPSPFFWVQARALENFWKVARELPVPAAERLYAESRLHLGLPPALGRDLRRALVDLTYLSRLRPDLASIDFWLGRAYELRGNLEAARGAFERGDDRVPAEPRCALFLREDGHLRHLQEDLDGVGFGLSPALFYSPVVGIGADIGIKDDRLWDHARSASASLWGATRGVWAARGELQDGESLPGQRLRIAGAWRHGVWDFYGLGPDSRLADRSELEMEEGELEVCARASFAPSAFFTLGWRFQTSATLSASGPSWDSLTAPDKTGLAFTGPFAELTLDTRDSRFEPRSGTLLGIKGFFPTQGLGSPATFRRGEGRAEHHLLLSPRQWISLGAVAQYLDPGAPFSAYAHLSGTARLPGVRAWRFVDRDLAGLFVEHDYQAGGPFEIGLFATAGSVCENFPELFTGVWRWGGGVSLNLALSRYRVPSARFELGYFAGETIFQALAGTSL